MSDPVDENFIADPYRTPGRQATSPLGVEHRTRQGVRDLNPKGYNAKPASCPCHRNPEIPTRVEVKLRVITRQTAAGPISREEAMGVHMCAFCGRERFSEHDEA